jgi:endonuclease YncB( thermonuclease family)
MAVRKSKSSTTQKVAGEVSKWALGKIFKKSFLVIILLIAGGVLFNLDRIGNLDKHSLSNILPDFMLRLLPEKSIPEGKAAAEQILTGKAINIYDGDTMTLIAGENGESKKYKIRFFGIDAPEIQQEHGTISRDALNEMIGDKEVRVEVVSVDRYGRCVGKVYHGENYINRAMVAAGNAWFYADYAEHEYDLANAEADARRRRIGIWQKADPQAPWMYRKEKRLQ